jgi:hypothetical protein
MKPTQLKTEIKKLRDYIRIRIAVIDDALQSLELALEPKKAKKKRGAK